MLAFPVRRREELFFCVAEDLTSAPAFDFFFASMRRTKVCSADEEVPVLGFGLFFCPDRVELEVELFRTSAAAGGDRGSCCSC